MKTLYIEARKTLVLDESKLKELEKILPNTIYIAYSVQYKQLAQEIKKRISKKVTGFSQVLGCTDLKTSSPILFIGNGRFHALNLAISSSKEVFIFDNHIIDKIGNPEIERQKKIEQGRYSKFLISERVGILASLKQGQENFNLSRKIKTRVSGMKKKVYLFLADDIQVSELENFNLPIYINTACPGLELDSIKLLNYRSIKNHI